MSLGRFVRDLVAPSEIGELVEPSPRVHRRRRALARRLTARARTSAPRARNLLPRRPLPATPKLTGHHDYGDGRHAVEFEGPSLDMMLYHDRGVTLAEWVTLDGRLVSMIEVGVC